MRNEMMIFIFAVFDRSTLFGKVGPNYQIYYNFLLKLFILVISSFCFGKLIKISENASPLQIFLLINNEG